VHGSRSEHAYDVNGPRTHHAYCVHGSRTEHAYTGTLRDALLGALLALCWVTVG
jgi:hypothetical protein